MDAISCPAPAALLPTSTSAFADAAIARALHFSTTTTMSLSPDSSASASSSSSSLSHHHSPLLLADLPPPCTYYAQPPVPLPPHALAAATCRDSVLVADSSPRRRRSSPPGRQQTHHLNSNHALLAPAGARAGKRRSRASKRAPTTYISTDAANFRLMVQHITGVQADLDHLAGGVSGVDMAMLHHAQALDAAALLAAAAGNGNGHPQLLPAGDDASALRQHQLHLDLQQQEQQPCFPTLDSWNVAMYEANSAEML